MFRSMHGCLAGSVKALHCSPSLSFLRSFSMLYSMNGFQTNYETGPQGLISTPLWLKTQLTLNERMLTWPCRDHTSKEDGRPSAIHMNWASIPSLIRSCDGDTSTRPGADGTIQSKPNINDRQIQILRKLCNLLSKHIYIYWLIIVLNTERFINQFLNILWWQFGSLKWCVFL